MSTTIDDKEARPTEPMKMVSRTTMTDHRTLNDHVDEIHQALWRNVHVAYTRYLEAVYDEDAVEGSLVADDLKAAEIIRHTARENQIQIVANKKLATIAKVLNIVLSRYHMTREERASRIGGLTI